jgi:hypothetical protein
MESFRIQYQFKSLGRGSTAQKVRKLEKAAEPASGTAAIAAVPFQITLTSRTFTRFKFTILVRLS